jgi:hypothetical protein
VLKLNHKYQLFFCFVLFFINLSAQKEYKPFGVKGTFHNGFIAPHRSVVNEIIEGQTKVFELSVYKYTSGEKQWQRLYNYPKIGISLLYFDLANTNQLGNSLGITPYFSFFVTNKKIAWEVKFGAGIGYIEKPFDRVNNYKNLAIGSSFNALISANSQLSIQLNNKLSTSLGLSIIHFSNGAFTMPNLGINILSLNMGMAYRFGENKTQFDVKIEERERTWSKNVTLGFGLKEILPVEGPKYFTTTTSFNFMKVRSNKSTFGVGLDLFYNSSLTQLIAQDTSKTQTNFDNFRGGLTVIYSLDFGKFSTLLQLGGYFFAKEKKKGLIYNRLTTRYHLNDKVFINLGLKTHIAVADFVEVGVGYKIK